MEHWQETCQVVRRVVELGGAGRRHAAKLTRIEGAAGWSGRERRRLREREVAVHAPP